MTTACVIQARLGSSRLPAKVLLPLPTGRAVLQEVMHRCCRIPGIDKLVVAIPDTAENDILDRLLWKWASEYCATVVRGPEHDVLARYAKAAEAVNADVIMRITSDCPLLDPSICGLTLGMRNEWDYDFVSNSWPSRHFPQGFDCEVFTRDTLDRANEEATDPVCREHVTPYMQRSLTTKKGCLKASNDLSHLRWTLDTKDDFVRIWNILEQQMREAA